MVKFGRHVQFFLENDHKGSDLYIVDYNEIRDKYIPNNKTDQSESSSRDLFIENWKTCLNRATVDFQRAMTQIWSTVFDGIFKSNPAESRGALPDDALRFYIQSASENEVHELLAELCQIHAAALTNAEALRKLVKKYDKDAEKKSEQVLSSTLLPIVYSANFTIGQSTLEAGLALLRGHFQGFEDVNGETNSALEGVVGGGDNASNEMNGDISGEVEAHYRMLRSSSWNGPIIPMSNSSNNEDDDVIISDEHLVSSSSSSSIDSKVIEEMRKSELKWLRAMIHSIPFNDVSHLVSHRGFHNYSDRSDIRPLENSLSAYEAAWTSGVHLCECDVALTKDEKLILAHDDDFRRLALDPTDPLASVSVSELTLRQIISLTLKCGTRPPLLIDVLRSARMIGGTAQLVIEIKPGNWKASTALARLFGRHPELISCCAVVMSFDAFVMHDFRRNIMALKDQLVQKSDGNSKLSVRNLAGGITGGLNVTPSFVSLPTSMSLGHLGRKSISQVTLPPGESMLSMNNGSTGSIRHIKTMDSVENFDVGLNSDDLVRNQESFVFTPFNSHMDSSSLLKEHQSPILSHQQQNISKISSINNNPESKKPQIPLTHNAKSHQRLSINSINMKLQFPKLMLLTVNEPPSIPCELWVDVSDLSPIDGWLATSDGSLDGVYLQYQPAMMESSGAQALRLLSEREDGRRYTLGVWGLNGRDPDDWETFQWFIQNCGMNYVNTGLQKDFKKDVVVPP
eukprot:CAMPEP_0194402848 /NCGR_PEP_ID=MMETSP0176-20130528/1504_1 /TAXON_ID=216777 /ORGANISM="Proboscia alata, Strain PI-D3" /LENGTH=740 /DNA_ID=CAMNT_0039200387 /DNA_START=88 /DNA_END=2310 /DNA_ORIENTATION=+